MWSGGITNLEYEIAFAIATLRAIADTTVVLVICKLRLGPDFACAPPFGWIGVTRVHFLRVRTDATRSFVVQLLEWQLTSIGDSDGVWCR